jgi:hypothetical protein
MLEREVDIRILNCPRCRNLGALLTARKPTQAQSLFRHAKLSRDLSLLLSTTATALDADSITCMTACHFYHTLLCDLTLFEI